MVRMLAFSADDNRLASSEPEVSAPFHIGHCATAVVATQRTTKPAAKATRFPYANHLMGWSLRPTGPWCQMTHDRKATWND
jgi:hypothetical protein